MGTVGVVADTLELRRLQDTAEETRARLLALSQEQGSTRHELSDLVKRPGRERRGVLS
ncbi:hypothetical protein [Actinomyces trachealis]|uniref:hypothetical protein n=1 Tax=Actinomyces trachealis TaxID=2763540 RepID=UPI0018C63638|nr:hypothetical protein [Actinomyces trachealis]